MSTELVTVEVRDAVATLTLNRPDVRNAMTAEMGRCVEAMVTRVNGMANVRAVVVTVAGRAFSAGGDLDSLAKDAGLADAGDGLGGGANFYSLYLSIGRLAVPSIAAINGHAIGAGLCFALACDLRLCGEAASFAAPFVKLGLGPDWGGTYMLPRMIGTSAALEVLFTGESVSSHDALRIGLANRVWPDSELRGRSRAFALALAGMPSERRQR